MKVCVGCEELLSLELFAVGQYGPTGNPWRRNRCRPCYNRYMREYKKARGYRFRKDQALRYKFGISIEDYDSLMETQGGVCAICGLEDKDFALGVDHNHETGEIRGLLCNPCNRALGLLKENKNNMANMIAYVEYYNE